MHRLRITSDAELDTAELAIYTLRRFGADQADRYSNDLDIAFDRIVQNPMIGTDCSQFGEGLRRLVCGQHAIYYAVLPEEVAVIRILGPGQDPAREL